MNIAIFSTKSYDKTYFEASNLDKKHTLTFFETAIQDNLTNKTLAFEAICVFVNDNVDKNAIQILAQKGTKIIALRSAGYNNIDLAAAKENNIKVVRVPAYSPQAVAEHAVALIMTLNRKTHKSYQRICENNFSLDKLIGFNIYQKTIGVIGTGLIGKSFCEIMVGFGAKILAYDIVKSQDLIDKGVKYTTLDDIYSQSDIISLHCPLVAATKHLLDGQAFAKMKNGVMLINTSRGAVICTKDAIEALKIKKIGYLGLDVYENEQPLFFKDLSETIVNDSEFNTLISFPNVLVTGHQAFLTHEAITQIAQITLTNISAFENGLHLKNEV